MLGFFALPAAVSFINPLLAYSDFFFSLLIPLSLSAYEKNLIAPLFNFTALDISNIGYPATDLVEIGCTRRLREYASSYEIHLPWFTALQRLINFTHLKERISLPAASDRVDSDFARHNARSLNMRRKIISIG